MTGSRMEPPEPRPSRDLARLHLWLGLPFGLLFLLLNPPFIGVADELAHYFKALEVAQGRILPGPGVSAPRAYVELRKTVSPTDLAQEGWQKVDLAAVRAGLSVRPGAEEVSVPTRVDYASPLGYAPQALALKLALLARAPPLAAFYLGRLFTWLSAMGLIYVAIRLARPAPAAFLVVALLPATTQQLASFSYDALHLGTTLLFAAYLLALADRPQPMTRNEWLLALVLCLAANATKPGYPWFALLAFLVPRERFGSRRAKLAFAFGCLAVAGAAVVLGRTLFGEIVPGREVDGAGNAQRILEDPFRFAAVVLRSVFRNGPLYLEGFVFRPGRAEEGLAPAFYVGAYLGLALLLAGLGAEAWPTRRRRLALLGTAALQAAFVFASLYVCCSPPGAPGVLGVQGRYFLVVLPLLLLALQRPEPGPVGAWIRRHERLALALFGVALHSAALGEIVRFYY